MAGGNSALASLTAQYTDSEEEEEEEIEAQLSSPSSPQVDSNSQDIIDAPSPTGSVGGGTSRSRNLLGLVSYQDDLIDDEAIDDYQSDSAQDTTEEKTLTEDSQQSEHAVVEEDKSVINIDDTIRRVRIPPEPPGRCSSELQDRIAKLYDRKQSRGLDMNKYIQCNKNFRNPSIYEKLIKHCNIDELGTNYPRDIYDPHVWGDSSYYDELAKVQKTEMERREKEKKERTKVEFQSGTVKKPIALPSLPSTQPEMENKRKSKWDQRGVMPTLIMPLPTVQPVVVHPNITTSVTGTKSTVINAFGNFPKKNK